MVRVGSFVVVLVTAATFLLGVGTPASASAAEPGPALAAPAGDAEEPGPATPHESGPVVVAPAVINVPAAPPTTPGPVYGVSLRARYVSVPHWFLGLFTKHNVPLSTFGHFGIEGFRRLNNVDIAVALSYQNMSPPDGNWLGSGRDATMFTRYLQFRGLALYSADISFIWHTMFTSWLGMHAGAGLGAAIVGGSLYLNVSEGCTDTNLGDSSQCHPRGFTCANGVCTTPPGFVTVASSDVLPVIPIVNVVFGIDFRLPNVNGWEAKLEAGFYDAFFAGFGVGYTF